MASERELDLLIICPENSKIVYQELSKSYSAVELPMGGRCFPTFPDAKGTLLTRRPKG